MIVNEIIVLVSNVHVVSPIVRNIFVLFRNTIVHNWYFTAFLFSGHRDGTARIAIMTAKNKSDILLAPFAISTISAAGSKDEIVQHSKLVGLQINIIELITEYFIFIVIICLIIFIVLQHVFKLLSLLFEVMFMVMVNLSVNSFHVPKEQHQNQLLEKPQQCIISTDITTTEKIGTMSMDSVIGWYGIEKKHKRSKKTKDHKGEKRQNQFKQANRNISF